MNFAERQQKIDAGDLTPEQASRLGATHKAYGWAPSVPVWWRTVTREDISRAWTRFVGTAIAAGVPLDAVLLPALIADALVLLEPIHEDPESVEAIATDLTVGYAEGLFRDLVPEEGLPNPALAILRERYDAAAAEQERVRRLYARALRAAEFAESERDAQEHAQEADRLREPMETAFRATDAAAEAYRRFGGVL